MKQIVIEIFHGGDWHQVATYQNGASLSYNIDYVLAHMDDNAPLARIGLNYPVNFSDYRENGWPPFLLDLLPAGAARQAWLKRIDLKDNESADWPLLCFAAGNPPGNLRIASAVNTEKIAHPGFSRDEIIERNIDFIDYAEAAGAIIAGASSVQGQAPKFLLIEDHNGRWHAEGALDDPQVKQHWLVKFPRGKTTADRTVLRNEAPYYEIARAFGLRVAAPLEYRSDTLFIRRFDRWVNNGQVERFGLESMTSLCQKNTFGARISNNEICAAVCRYTSQPLAELQEYFRRDILNLALGNTDNHGRNTAVLKRQARIAVELSPLFDFAPMFLDPEGIPRMARWDNEVPGRLPEWGLVAEAVAGQLIDKQELRIWIAAEAEKVERLPEMMQVYGIDYEIIEKLARRIDDLAVSLRECTP